MKKWGRVTFQGIRELINKEEMKIIAESCLWKKFDYKRKERNKIVWT